MRKLQIEYTFIFLFSSLYATFLPSIIPVQQYLNEHCGKIKTESRIVGGTTASFGSQPWYVLLLVCNKQKTTCQRCGATVISHKHILTAAHCFYDEDNWYIELFPSIYSEPSCKTPHITISSSANNGKVKLHENFASNTFKNDIAIIELNKRLPVFGEAGSDIVITPICLPYDDLVLNFGDSLTVAGMGYLEYNGEPADTLQKVEVEYIMEAICNQPGWYYNSFFPDVQLCAGFVNGGFDACQGDSGGPLIYFDEKFDRWFLVGIVSAGEGCALPKRPGIYTKVKQFADWIEKHSDIKSSEPVESNFTRMFDDDIGITSFKVNEMNCQVDSQTRNVSNKIQWSSLLLVLIVLYF